MHHGYAVDLDGDGMLEQGEIHQILREIGLPLGPNEEQRLCEELDRDGDGQVAIEEIQLAIDKADTLLAP
eukprot:SAG31_NODE_23404_length_505_cov_0.869458_1_plen_69_part_10